MSAVRRAAQPRLKPGLWSLTTEAAEAVFASPSMPQVPPEMVAAFDSSVRFTVQPVILQAATCSCYALSPTVWHDIITVGGLPLHVSLAIQLPDQNTSCL